MYGPDMIVEYDPRTDTGSISAMGKTEGSVGPDARTQAQVVNVGDEAASRIAMVKDATLTLQKELARLTSGGIPVTTVDAGMVGSGDTPTRDD